MKRRQGIHVSPEIRARGIAMLKAGDSVSAIARELNVSDVSIRRWKAELKPAKAKPKAKPKATSATNYLAKQLEIVAKMIRAKLPELARFALTTTDDGKASIEYSVRQTSVVTGTVKL